MKKDLFIYLQYIIPHKLTSRLVSKLAESKNKTLKNYLINLAIKKFNINIHEAQFTNINEYSTFNDFFTRKLKNGVRPLNSDHTIICSPADGILSEFGKIKNNTLIQAKNKDFSLKALIGNSSEVKFTDFATIYLSPKDYHRVHMPIDGCLTKMVYIPGKLFSVNKITTNRVDNLFAKNERLICYFKTKIGLIAIIFVGALLVAGIQTIWYGKIPNNSNNMQVWNYDNERYNINFQKGETIGWFDFGSTVIILTPNNKVKFNFDKNNSSIKVNQDLALIFE